MASYRGSIPENDPRHNEGFKIIGFNNESKCDDSAEDQKLIEYLPESSREHEVIGKWLSLMQERGKGLLPSSNVPANNMSGDLELDSVVASIVLDALKDRLPNYRWYDREGNLKSVRGKKVIKKRKSLKK